MSRLSNWISSAIAVLVLSTGVESFAAVPPAENLLPNSSKGFLAVGSVDQLKESWNKTQLGQLIADPTMQPFVESFQEQMAAKWSQTHQKLGISWQDLDGVPSGEVAAALIQPSEKEVYMAVVADVTGHVEQTNALLEKINKNMTAQKGVRSQKTFLNAKVTIWDVPKHEETAAHQVVYFVSNDQTLVGASDNLKVIEGILARAAEPRSDSLASLPSFEAVTKRCRLAAGQLAPHARWFVDPFGYADAVRQLNSDTPRKKGTDMLKILREQGFTAVQGLGGFVNFSVDTYEMLHRTFIFAPGNKSGERFELAARMLDLPNGGHFAPPEWVPRDIAMYAAVNLNSKNAFESSKTLVNEIVGDEVFEDVLESIKTDENGPKIDVRKDLIAYLGNRVTIISDLQLPITPKSERMLVAVETTNPQQLAITIQKQMETDEDAKRRVINGHVVWEVVDEQSELPMVTIENSPAFGAGLAAGEEEPEEKPLLPNSAVTVAYGQLFVATHIDILAKVLADEASRGKLLSSADFRRVEAEIEKLHLPEESARVFTRTDDAYRGTYELLRAGRMPEAESMIGKLLNSMMGEGKEGVLRTQRIDGSKLPEYDMVRRYFGPAGMTVTTEGDGWMLTGFTLVKEPEPSAKLQRRQRVR